MIRITIMMKSLIDYIRTKIKIQSIDSFLDRIIDIFINKTTDININTDSYLISNNSKIDIYREDIFSFSRN